MKRPLFLLLALLLWLSVPIRAQDAEALGALVGVLKEVDDPAFHFDILKLKRKVKVHAKRRHLQLLVTKVADYLSNKITQAGLIWNLALLGL